MSGPQLDLSACSSSRDDLRLAEADDGEVGFRRSGAYVMVLETDDRAQSNLAAMRFNDHLSPR